jgi:hypothetical protein
VPRKRARAFHHTRQRAPHTTRTRHTCPQLQAQRALLEAQLAGKQAAAEELVRDFKAVDDQVDKVRASHTGRGLCVVVVVVCVGTGVGWGVGVGGVTIAAIQWSVDEALRWPAGAVVWSGGC